MSDFDLEKSKWFNATGIERSCSWLRTDAEAVTGYVRALSSFDHDPSISKSIAEAETALSDALLAVKLAKSAYAKQFSVAAE